MQIAYNEGPLSTLVITEKDKNVFLILNEVFNGKEEDCHCQSSGYISIYSKNKVVLDAWFATSATGSRENCQYLIIKVEGKNKCYRLNYRLGMYLDELYNDIKPR